MDDDERIMRAVRHALNLTRTEANVSVRVHPDDADAVKSRDGRNHPTVRKRTAPGSHRGQ